MKKCFTCKIEKSLNSFSFNNRNKDKRCGKCKECQAKWRKDNIQRIRPQRTRYTQKNLEKAIFAAAKSRAKKNGLEFSIDISDIIIPERCPVFNIQLKRSSEKRDYGSPSLEELTIQKVIRKKIFQ